MHLLSLYRLGILILFRIFLTFGVIESKVKTLERHFGISVARSEANVAPFPTEGLAEIKVGTLLLGSRKVVIKSSQSC